MTDSARGLLERAAGRIDATESESRQLSREIRAYLAEPEQDEEPVAWVDKWELEHIKDCEPYVSKDPVSANDVPLFLHPTPRPEFVRLSEEEISEIEARIPPKMDLAEAKKKFAHAIQDALEAKNS